ncbi:MAG: DUF4091 domain-containing protein [Porphyromonas sp.]|nr:DUF4091 domain-containing protein [Porphyromonas sp.]
MLRLRQLLSTTALVATLALLPACNTSEEKEEETAQIEWYQELPNPTPTDPAKWAAIESPIVSWGTCDMRYPKEEPFSSAEQSTIKLTGWRGEDVSAQLVVSTPTAMDALRVRYDGLREENGAGTIDTDQLSGGFVRYVMTDELNKDGLGGCGERPDNTLFDSLLVADPIDHLALTLSMTEKTSTGYWLNIAIPDDLPAGTYVGEVEVLNDEQLLGKLALELEVQDATITPLEERSFLLDLWQNPFAIARVHGVELWSEEHFDAIKPYMELYRSAGGNTITASITHKPWNGQTYDHFESMVRWIKKADGTWDFDYTVFDKWVSFMLSLGIDKQINCYSMVPWQLSFLYYDEAEGKERILDTAPGEEAYTEVWSALLSSFAEHLKERGWFSITHIAMDERPKEVMQEVLRLVKNIDPDFKTSLAGDLHDEFIDVLDYYCPPLRTPMSEAQKEARRAKGFVTTFYTCCSEPRPNTFTFSEPADPEWYGWYAAGQELDGYLRWALNSWVKNPLQDSRYINWAGGDTYLIYPGPRTSIRFERLKQGIQSYAKVEQLRTILTEKGDTAELARMDEVLAQFDPFTLLEKPSAQVTAEAREYVAELTRRLAADSAVK